jgi:hypothetical protein
MIQCITNRCSRRVSAIERHQWRACCAGPCAVVSIVVGGTTLPRQNHSGDPVFVLVFRQRQRCSGVGRGVMSYLLSPRLSFPGRFMSDVSTMNNLDQDSGHWVAGGTPLAPGHSTSSVVGLPDCTRQRGDEDPALDPCMALSSPQTPTAPRRKWLTGSVVAVVV